MFFFAQSPRHKMYINIQWKPQMPAPIFCSFSTRADGFILVSMLKIAAVDENALHECGIWCWKVFMQSQSVPLNWHTDIPRWRWQPNGWRSRLVIAKSAFPLTETCRENRVKNDCHSHLFWFLPRQSLESTNNYPNVLVELLSGDNAC